MHNTNTNLLKLIKHFFKCMYNRIICMLYIYYDIAQFRNIMCLRIITLLVIFPLKRITKQEKRHMTLFDSETSKSNSIVHTLRHVT